MIEIIQKDITTVDSGVVAHGVNCQRRMGSGVALAIKNKWPEIYEAYMRMPGGKEMLGTAHAISIHPVFEDLFVVNCYTQEFYGPGDRKYADVSAIEEALVRVMSVAEEYNLDVYLPEIGGGLGGLNFATVVFPIIQQLSTSHNVNTYICIIDQESREYNHQ